MGYLPEHNDPEAVETLSVLKRHYGFVPRVFREQWSRPDLVMAQAKLLEALLFKPGALTRVQKEFILLAVSSANSNSYFPAVHARTVQFLGVEPAQAAAVTADHRQASLTETDVALLDFARKLARHGNRLGAQDVEELRARGFSDEEILEAVLMVGVTHLLNAVQMGLGTEPDLKPRANLSAKEVNPDSESERPMLELPKSRGAKITGPRYVGASRPHSRDVQTHPIQT